MTATIEQTQSDLPRLVDLVQQGEEVVITNEGRAVAKLTSVKQPAPSLEKSEWLKRLAGLRESTATGKNSPSTEEILEDLRSDRS